MKGLVSRPGERLFASVNHCQSSHNLILRSSLGNLSLRLRLNAGHNHSNPCLTSIHFSRSRSTVAVGQHFREPSHAQPSPKNLRSVLAPLDLGTPEISNSSTQFAICETSPAGSHNQTYNTC
ncbi:putative J domain-containing protein [Fusarium oxysporum f. sp. albedinis]|nr:putative J domain-containing protein [Fusarium oxysporum f. sp. albedinis]